MAKASTADAAPAKKGGLMGLLVPLLVLTLLAGGGGGLIGMQIVASVKASLQPKPTDAPGTAPAAPAGPERAMKELAPVVTNLAAPDQQSWVRLQAAVVYDKADAAAMDVLAASIGDDILAYVRTLSLTDLQGAAGLQHLREDLGERASIRSDGHVHELMIETLVIQ